MNECPFCRRYRQGEFEETDFFAVMCFEPLNPVTPGHMLFMPISHISHAREVPIVTARIFEAACTYAARQQEDFNLIVSDGQDATQTVHHLHVHYVPRRPGDGLTLPWTGQAR